MVKKLIFLFFSGIGFSAYCQTNFNVTFLDVANNTDIGFDDPTSLATLKANGDITQAQFDFHNGTNNTLGAIRRATAKEVLKYIETTINMGSTTLDAEFAISEMDGTGSIGEADVQYTNNGGVLEAHALRHIQSGSDPDISMPDIDLVVDFGYGINSDYSAVNTLTADLYSILLHECTHALGIASSMLISFDPATQSAFYNQNGPFNSWDLLLKVNNNGNMEDVVLGSSWNPATQIFSNEGHQVFYHASGIDLDFRLTSNYPPKPGTTFSHFEPGERSIDFVMSPSGTSNTIVRTWNDIELMALCDLGYTLLGNASTYPYGCTLPPVGVEDILSYSVNGGWQAFDILANDEEVGSNGLEPDRSYGNNGFISYNNQNVGQIRWKNGKLEYFPDPDFCGTITLVYQPKDATTGRSGTSALVYINVPCATCPDNPCSYICNGEFENGIPRAIFDSRPNYKDFVDIAPPQQSPVDFWWECRSTLDLLMSETSRTAHQIGAGSNPNTYNGDPDNNRYIRSYSHTNYGGSGSLGEGAVTQTMSLSASDLYTLSFQTYVENNNMASSTIGIFHSPDYYLLQSNADLNTRITNGEITQLGVITVPSADYGQWVERDLTLTGLSGNQYIYFLPTNITYATVGVYASTYFDAIELVEQGPQLEVSISADNQGPRKGENVEFTIEITNNGTVDATNVAVVDVLPVQMAYVTSDFNAVSGTTYAHTFASIPAGSTTSIHITGNVLGGTTECDPIFNTFEILSATPSIGCNKLEYSEWVLPQGVCGCEINDDCSCLFDDPDLVALLDGPFSIPCGGSILLNAGLGFDSYLWSTGETTSSITVSQPGTILLTVGNSNDCEETIEIVVETNCCDVSSVAQTFEKEYYSNKYGILTQAIIKNPSNDLYIIIGTSYDKTVGDGQAMADRGLTLIGVDLLGEQQWIKKYTIADLYPSIYNHGVILYDQIGMRIQDAKAGPNTFLMTGATFNTNYDWESFVGQFAYDGSLISIKEYRNAGGHLLLNSIDNAYDATGSPDGYLITGSKFSSSSNEIIFGKFDHSGSVVWDQSISFPSVYTAYSHGMESCPNININTSALDGYMIAGIHGYSNGTALDQSLVLMRSDNMGYVTQIVRLHQAYHPGSDFKLLPTTMNGGLDRAFLFMYSTGASGSSTQDIIRIIKFDQNFNTIWAHEYEATSGYDFSHAYDILEDGGSYKVLARNSLGKGALFNIDQNGIPTSSEYKYTGLNFFGGTYFDDFYIEGYNDRILLEGGNLVSAGIGSNTGASLIRWDANHETTCTHPNPMGHQHFAPVTSAVTDQFQQHAGLVPYLVDASPITISSNVYCCDNNNFGQVEKGCYFIPDFDFEIGCDEVTITETSIFGIMSGAPTYQWSLDGSNVASIELPTLTGIAQGTHTICLTMSYFPGCSKTVCKNIILAPDTVYDTIRACNEFVTYTPEDCATHESYILVDHDPSDDGMGFDYNYNSLNGGPGCAGWTNHDLKHGHYTINFFNDDNCLEKVLELDITDSDHDTIIECDTIWTCKTDNWYMPDSCGKYYSYEIFDQDPSDDNWHNYNYNSLTNPTYGGPGCTGWIYHNFILGNYVINFYDEFGCTKKILKIAVVSKDTVRTTKDIYVCPGQCATIDITDPDYFCQPNNGYFYGSIDDGTQILLLPSTTQMQICPPMTGSYEFITHTATGCVCIVTGNIIYYSPCPLPSGPADEPTSLGETEGESLQVYPNPTEGLLQVTFEGEIEPGATLTVTDIVGREFLSQPLTSFQSINLSEMAPGTYVIQVKNGRTTSFKRVVKE